MTHPQGFAAHIRPAGDRALLVQLAPQLPVAVADRLRARRIAGVIDVLPAATTVFVTFTAGAAPAVRQQVQAVVAEVAATPAPMPHGPPIVIPVHYDGADLADTADLLGITVAQLIARHTGSVWRCAFLGFAPGFGYLEAPDAGLAVPRLASPRTSVPVGAVGLAAGYSAVYPRSSPGGWRLVGRTATALWDEQRRPPAVLSPGARVKFVETAQFGEPAPRGQGR